MDEEMAYKMAEKKYIDADEMIANENEAYKRSLAATNGTETAVTNLFVHLKINKLLQDTPAVDVVEVVRCKDCESYIRYPKLEDFDGRCVGCIYPHDTDEDDYCSYGKRKEGK